MLTEEHLSSRYYVEQEVEQLVVLVHLDIIIGIDELVDSSVVVLELGQIEMHFVLVSNSRPIKHLLLLFEERKEVITNLLLAD